MYFYFILLRELSKKNYFIPIVLRFKYHYVRFIHTKAKNNFPKK